MDREGCHREKEVQNWARQIAKEKGKNGVETKLGYQKIKIDTKCYRWEEKVSRKNAGEVRKNLPQRRTKKYQK